MTDLVFRILNPKCTDGTVVYVDSLKGLKELIRVVGA